MWEQESVREGERKRKDEGEKERERGESGM